MTDEGVVSFIEKLLDCLHSSLYLSIACRIVGAASGMVELVALCKFGKFPGGELWTIVTTKGLRDAVSGKH